MTTVKPVGMILEENILCDENTVCMWFMKLDEGSDWMGALREVEQDKEYQMVYRHRYYEDDKFFESKDRKSWYWVKCMGTRSYVLAAMRHVVDEMKKVATDSGPVFELLNEHGIEEFMRKLMEAPFAVVKMIGPKEG